MSCQALNRMFFQEMSRLGLHSVSQGEITRENKKRRIYALCTSPRKKICAVRKPPLPKLRKEIKPVNAEVLARLKKARLKTCTSLQEAGVKLGVAMSTLYWMEHGRCPMSQEQADALARFYGERACAIAANVAAVLA